MNSIISISIPTEYGINIYSSKIIQNTMFYIQLLKSSDISITIEYSNKKDIFKIEDIISLFMIDDNVDSINHFNGLYNGQFNSSKIKLFDLIDESYLKQNGFSWFDSPIIKKYNDLQRKISITEKSLDGMMKNFDDNSRSKISKLRLSGTVVDECRKLLLDPIQNENKIVKNLELILREYSKIKSSQITLPILPPNIEQIKQKEIDSILKSSMTIKKNSYGQFIYEKYNFVFDPKDKCIIGVSNRVGGLYPLDEENIKLCNRMGLKFRL